MAQACPPGVRTRCLCREPRPGYRSSAGAPGRSGHVGPTEVSPRPTSRRDRLGGCAPRAPIADQLRRVPAHR